MTPGPDPQKKLEQLRLTIQALEAQRGKLPDEVLATSLAAVQAQIDEVTEIEPAAPDGGDDIQVGDIDKAQGVAIGRGARAHIVNLYLAAAGPADLNEETFSKALVGYLEWVEERHGRLNLRGVERREQRVLSLSLEDVYLSLEADLSPDRVEERAKSRREIPLEDRQPQEERQIVDMGQLLSLSQRLVIVGGPGSGKTTYLQIITAGLAKALLRGDTAGVKQLLGLEGELPLPIFVPLSEYNHYRRNCDPAAEARQGTLLKFISHHLIRQQGAIGLPEDFFERLLISGKSCILLLDGLDEVANERERWLVSRAVENLANNRGVRSMVVTSRTQAYREQAVLPEIFRPCTVRPLSPEQVNELAGRWCQAVYGGSEAEEETAALQATINNLESLRQARNEARLINSPLLVTIVAIVHYNERRLPDQRAELYERCVDVLLAEKLKAPSEAVFELVDWGGKVPEKRNLLAYLAYQMMLSGQEAGRSVEEAQLKNWLRPRFVRQRGEEEAGPLLDSFIQAMRERGSLLEERGGRYNFLHLTFQEYLCAYYLAENVREVDKIVAFLVEDGRLVQAWWRETILLVAGYLAIKSQETALSLLNGLAGLERADAPALAGAELAGVALLELDGQDPATVARVTGRLAALLTGPALSAANELRALAGQALGRLGDPRPKVNSELPFMVDIPAGPFLMGSDMDKDGLAYKDELPQHEVTLPAYRIGRYPVTVAQYRRFIKAGGYHKEDFWTPGGWRWQQETGRIAPDYWNDSRWTIPNHPVVGASWYEAVAYCAWLSESSGRIFQLPSEAQWEKAARGSQGRLYPWGDSWDPARLNSGEDEIRETTAVGIFPGGRSPYGLDDCSGNVFEWCSGLGYDEKITYPFELVSYQDDLAREGRRALRGGAFYYYQQDVRAAFRDDYNPDYRDDNIGFRVVEHLSSS